MVNELKPNKKKDVETLLKKQFGDNWMDNQELDWFKNNIFHTSPVAIAETSQINDEDDDHKGAVDAAESRENFKGCIREVSVGGVKKDWPEMESLHHVLLDSCPTS
ncbi:unnamed protein product [Colias eurytheme]|nr:unnamed protein product [Colias eurytheme]